MMLDEVQCGIIVGFLFGVCCGVVLCVAVGVYVS